MAPTPVKTPQSKQRLNFSNPKTEHPVEVIGRIRSLPERNFKPSPSPALEISGNGRSLRLRSDSGYRDFILDGVSLSESESLEAFYERFVEPRIAGVRSGGKCTVMMYGPTGAGKSHTMFGSSAEPGIVYRALKGILGEGEGDLGLGIPLFAQVAVLEIYNEEIYDLLLSGNCAQANKGSTPKARLEVMGRKAKNASYICGNEAGKLSREIAKVEKRRIIKNTLLNERSSRSHCVIILDVPSVGGRLMLVDMAGSENIEQAGQAGFEAKIQTAKINQGNIALKRVVESIANGDSHVPFRDSKLTMLLQDSFEDENSKILMILCASPDPKEMHKTIATLEYGAKAKCIVRVAHMPTPRDKLCGEDSSPLLRSRIVAMNQFIYKLQMENKVKDKECDKARRDLLCKEEEILQLRSKIHLIEGRPAAAVKEEEIRCVVDERTRALRIELRKMEEKVHQQQEELYSLRKRLEERESIKCAADDDNEALYLHDGNGGKFLKRLAEICPEDQGMEKSMDLDLGDQEEPETRIHDVREIEKEMQHNSLNSCVQENNICFGMPKFPEKLCLSTVFERDDEGEDRDGMEEEVDKEVVECIEHKFASLSKHQTEDFDMLLGLEDGKDSDSTRRTRIQNIFRLCGNHRELAQHVAVPTPIKRKLEDASFHSLPLSQNKELFVSSSLIPPLPKIPVVDGSQQELKENKEPAGVEPANMMNVYVKWEASKEFSGNMIRKMLVMKSSTLSDLRKLIEIHLEEINNKQPFTFLMLADPLGAPVPVEKEDAILVSKLPACNGQQNTHLACLRPARRSTAQWQNHTPFSSLENTLLPLQEMKTSS